MKHDGANDSSMIIRRGRGRAKRSRRPHDMIGVALLIVFICYCFCLFLVAMSWLCETAPTHAFKLSQSERASRSLAKTGLFWPLWIEVSSCVYLFSQKSLKHRFLDWRFLMCLLTCSCLGSVLASVLEGFHFSNSLGSPKALFGSLDWCFLVCLLMFPSWHEVFSRVYWHFEQLNRVCVPWLRIPLGTPWTLDWCFLTCLLTFSFLTWGFLVGLSTFAP